jgi:hypothetical protein
MLTVMAMVCSVQRVVVGDDRIGMNSDEVWRKGICRFIGFHSPLDVGLLQDDEELEMPFPNHPTALGWSKSMDLRQTPVRSSVYWEE